jgi:hypothetical protein
MENRPPCNPFFNGFSEKSRFVRRCDCALSKYLSLRSLVRDMKYFSILLLLIFPLHADVPKIFKGLLEKDVPIKASIGIVVPPPEITKYIAKVEVAARENKEWFAKYTKASKPGAPLPFHKNLGLTMEEYEDYLAQWAKRDFKSTEEVIIVLRESLGKTWSITATGEAGVLSILRYDSEKDVYRSPNGEMKRLEDIKAEATSILGAWSGCEWRLEEETGLGKVKENFAVGRYDDKQYGLLVYRVQEISSEGSRLLDKSLVVRFALGKAEDLPKQSNPR